MEGMINFDGLKITEEVATKYLWEINPDAAPTEGVDFFQMYSEGWRGKGAQDSIDNLLNWILNGVTWSIDEKTHEVEVLDGFPRFCPDFVAFCEASWGLVAIDEHALTAYLEDKIDSMGGRESLEAWIREQKDLEEGEDWKIAPPEDADEKEGGA